MSAIVLTRPIAAPSVKGLTISVINGQPMLTLEDTTRSDKMLSVSEQVLPFGENQLDHLDWIRLGNASDADSGFIADFDGTVTSFTAHCENTGTASKGISLYIDNTDLGILGLLAGGTNATASDQTLNFDFTQGQRLRLRAIDGANGTIQDTVVKLTIKWRAV